MALEVLNNKAKAYSFEENTLAALDGYVGVVSLSTAQARTGSRSLLISAGSAGGQNCMVIFTNARDEFFIQASIYFTSPYSSDYTWLRWYNGATLQGSLNVEANTGKIKAIAAGVQVGTSTTPLGGGVWKVVELRIKIHDTNGILQVKINGNLEIDFSGDTNDAASALIDTFKLWNIRVNHNLDDVIVFNTLGTKNNSWPNGLRAGRFVPGGAGNYAQWTPSAGENYECVDEIPPSTADHVSTNTDGNKDSYAFGNLPGDAKAVAAVIWDYWGVQVGTPATPKVKRLARIDAADYLSAALDVPNSFNFVQDVMEDAPDGGAWSVEKFNAAEFGMEASV